MSTPSSHVAVVGAGTSALVGQLVAAGHHHITALDVSSAALERLGAQLTEAWGARAEAVERVCADVLDRGVLDRGVLERVDVWHDRATFHFFTSDDECAAYARAAASAVRPGGHLVLSVFATDGPDRCSGLPVRRHDERSLVAIFGSHFDLVEITHESHRTPWDSEQAFVTALFRRNSDSASAASFAGSPVGR